MEKMYWFNVDGTVYRVVQYCFCLLTLYVFCALIRHAFRQYHMQCRGLCKKDVAPSTTHHSSESSSKQTTTTNQLLKKSSSRNSFRPRLQSHRNRDSVRYASQAMIGLSSLSCIFIISHILLDLWVFADKSRTLPKTLCIRQATSGILYFLCALCVYLFLWIRQRVFYAHPVLRHLAGPKLNRFSWSVFVTIILCLITFIAVYSIPNFFEWEKFNNNHLSKTSNYTATEKLGLAQNDTMENQPHNHLCFFKKKSRFLLIHFAVTLVFLYFQISLQVLFAYPVLCNRHKHKNPKQSEYSATSPAKDDILGIKTKIRNDPKSASTHNLVQLSTSGTEPASVANGVKEQSSSTSRGSMLLAKPQNVQQLSQMRKTRSDSALRRGDGKDCKASYVWLKKNSKSIGAVRVERCTSIACVNTQSKTKNFLPSSTNKTKLHLKSVGSFSSFRNSFIQEKKSKQRANTQNRLRHYIWRCFTMSFICCLSDLLAFGFSVYTQITGQQFYNEDGHLNNKVIFNLSETTPNVREHAVTVSLLSSLAYNGNMVVNLLCLVLCYDDWPSMLFPCCKKVPQKER